MTESLRKILSVCLIPSVRGKKGRLRIGGADSFVSIWSRMMIGFLGFVVMVGGIAIAPTLWTPFGVFVALFGVFIFVRCLRIRYCADDAGLLVRNVARTYRLPWNEVRAVRCQTFVPAGGFTRGMASMPAVALNLQSGVTVVSTATAGLGRKAAARVLAATEGHAAGHTVSIEATPDDFGRWEWPRGPGSKASNLGGE